MSVSASIDIILSEYGKDNQYAIEIIKVLMEFGWVLSHDGYVGYLPLGDKDDFDWQEKEISIERLTGILKSKQDAGEIVGITMSWKDTEIGGDFLFWPKDNLHTFSMNMDGNRRIIKLDSDYEVTDFQWYLPKLLLPLNKVWTVEYFSFDQHI
ncbi:hypothetical protein ACFLYH_02880 [Candidatus Dependentiae bacterium]